MPAQHAVAFLKFHIDPFGAAALGPVIKIVQRMLEIKARPNFVGCAAAPLDPIFEGEVRRVFDALRFLQRRADNTAAAAGNRRSAAAFRRRLQHDGFAADASRLQWLREFPRRRRQ